MRHVPYIAMSRCCERSSTAPETTGGRWHRSVCTLYSTYEHPNMSFACVLKCIPCHSSAYLCTCKHTTLYSTHSHTQCTMNRDIHGVKVHVIMCIHTSLYYIQCCVCNQVTVVVKLPCWIRLVYSHMCLSVNIHSAIAVWSDRHTAAEVRVREVTKEARRREGKKKVSLKWPRASTAARLRVSMTSLYLLIILQNITLASCIIV